MTIRRVVVGYIVLVLVPIAGLMAVLRAGESLKAPPNLEGTWAVSLDSPVNQSPVSKTMCGVRFDSSRLAFRISQSGSFAVISVNGQDRGSLQGQIRGNSLIAGVRSTNCASDPYVVTASIESPTALGGSFTPNGCVSCSPVVFRAALVKNATAGTRR